VSLRRDLPALAGLGVIAVALLVAIFAPALAPADPVKNRLVDRLTPPMWAQGGSAAHPLGTDTLGRDVLSRLLHGARISLIVGLAAVLVAGVVGVALGLVAGYRGGWADDLLMRLGDIQLAFPVLLLGVAVIAVLGASLVNMILVLGASGWVTYARIARGETLSLKERDFVAAARALGAPARHVVARHLLPNVLPPLMVVTTFSVARTIIAEASLSFLGLGVTEPTPSWGLMLSGSAADFYQQAPWMIVFPGIAISLGVFAFNLFGDSLRDWLDPKIKL
jgi:peptide/nickel transport system permease protein